MHAWVYLNCQIVSKSQSVDKVTHRSKKENSLGKEKVNEDDDEPTSSNSRHSLVNPRETIGETQLQQLQFINEHLLVLVLIVSAATTTTTPQSTPWLSAWYRLDLNLALGASSEMTTSLKAFLAAEQFKYFSSGFLQVFLAA